MKPTTIKNEFLYGDLTYIIRKALFAVHNELGMYAKEKQYGDKAEENLKIWESPTSEK